MDLRREIKRSDLNMLRLGCLLDTKIETLNRPLNIDIWGSGGRHSWTRTSEKPECVKKIFRPTGLGKITLEEKRQTGKVLKTHTSVLGNANKEDEKRSAREV